MKTEALEVLKNRRSVRKFKADQVSEEQLNAAYAAGLDSCWIHRSRQMFETEEGKALLEEWGIKENVCGIASIALGYRDMEIAPAKERRPDYIVRI